MAIIDDLAAAIARQEGTGCGSRNNPGNLRTWGDLPTSGGFAVFPTCEAGWAALRSQVQRNINRGLTLEEFFGGKAGVYPGYAPAADSNQPFIYAANVSTWTGIPMGVPLDQMTSGVSFFPDDALASDQGILTGVVLIALLGLTALVL